MPNLTRFVPLVCLLLSGAAHADTLFVPGAVSNGSSQPYPGWPSVRPDYENDPGRYVLELKEDEIFEARGALLWVPVIDFVTDEAVRAGAISPDHETLFGNLLFGLIAVETTGLMAQTGNFGESDFQRQIGSFRGLSQLVAEKLYLEENPYEPLTAIRAGLRNLAPFVYRARSVEAALAEHNNGRTTSAEARTAVDAFCTIGQEFAMRVLNASWWGNELGGRGDADLKLLLDRQSDPQNPNSAYYPYLPDWKIFDRDGNSVSVNVPDIPFNWTPPPQSQARAYIEAMPGSTFEEKRRRMIAREIRSSTWTDEVMFEYPVTGDPSTDKSACARIVGDDDIVLRAIDIPGFLFDTPLEPAGVELSLVDIGDRLDYHYPMGAFGRTPASVDGQHRYFVDGDIRNDVPGIDDEGNLYLVTPGTTAIAGGGAGNP